MKQCATKHPLFCRNLEISVADLQPRRSKNIMASPLSLELKLYSYLNLSLSSHLQGSAVPSRNNVSSLNPCSLIVAVSDAADVKFLES